MSCFPESTYAFYADGELAPDELHRVERHLVGCRRCRALVLTLREEAELLVDVLHERERHTFRLPRPAPPPRALAAGLLPTVGLGVLGLGVIGWILEQRLPAGADWLNPLRPLGVYEMAFDLLFLVRDRVPGLLELLVASAGLASVSLVLLFAVSLLSRRFTGTAALALAVLALVGAPVPARALDLHFREDTVEVPAGEVVDATMIVNADTVRVDGVVEGDLVVLLAERLVVRGEVRGNVFATARSVEIAGEIAGNLHAAGESVRLDGSVGRNMYSASERLTLAAGSRVGRDASHAVEGASVDGEVGRDLFVFGDWLELRGAVGRGVDARVDRVALLDGARVGGDVDALLWREEEVEVAPGAAIAGELRSSVHEHHHRSSLARYARPMFYVWLAIRLAAAGALGLLLYGLAPRLYAVRLASTGDFFRAFGVGFLVLVATPIALLLVAVTLLGIPVALVGLAAYLCALYVSGLLVAALLGTQLTRPGAEGWGRFATALVCGLAVLMLATALPFVGIPLRVVVLLTGLGLLVERLRAAWRATRLPA